MRGLMNFPITGRFEAHTTYFLTFAHTEHMADPNSAAVAALAMLDLADATV
jgi:hypothetical protein